MDDKKIVEEIHTRAAKKAQASVYSLDNQYLNYYEKQEVEMWFQLPGNFFLLVFWLTSILHVYYGFHWSYIFIVPMITDVVVGIINWYLYPKRLILYLYRSIFHNFVLYAIAIATCIFLILHGSYVFAVLTIIARFGVLTFLEPHLFFYSFLSRNYKMHPKYAFFKRHYNHEFPFE